MTVIEVGLPVVDSPELEVWKNPGVSHVVLIRFGASGSLIEERVVGGKKVHLTPTERKINEERCVEPEFNPFRNGMLAPVRLVNAEDEAEFASNPNLMTEEEMRSIVKANPKKFVERLAALTNPILVTRLRDIAYEEDASVNRVEAISKRLEKLAPKVIHSGGTSPDKA